MDDLDNRFKDSAENFSLIPSSGIWVSVEADIRKRERKRRFIIFFFLLAGILTGGIYFLNDHLTNSNTLTSIQKDSSKEIDYTTTQQTNPLKENIRERTDSRVSPTFPDKKIANSQQKQIAYSIPSSTIKNETGSGMQTTSIQNNLAVQQQDEISTSISTTISPAIADSMMPASISSITNYTLQSEAETDSVLTAKTDTSKQDNLPEKKDSAKTTPSKSKWSIVLSVAPTLSYSKLQERGDYQFISNYRDSSDKNLLTWNYHLTIHYKLLPEIELFTGIGIINFEQEILSKQTVYKYDTNPIISGPVPIITIKKTYYNINGDSTGTIKNKSAYLEIPVGVRYNFLSGHKFNISLQPEIAFNKLIQSGGYTYNYQNRIYEKIRPADLKPWLVSYGVGLSFHYAIIQNLCLELTPYYKSFQKSIYKPAYPITQRFQQTEFRLSLRYNLK